MNDTMWQMLVIDALAILSIHGRQKALRYMTDKGMTLQQAMNIINNWDRSLSRVILGQIP